MLRGCIAVIFAAIMDLPVRPDAIEPGKDTYSIGPVLPAEMTKAPYRPAVVGRIAFFFGPLAGAIVSVINLRRYGYPVKARRVFLWSLVGAVGLSVVLILTPDLLGRVLGLAAEFAFYKIFRAAGKRVRGVADGVSGDAAAEWMEGGRVGPVGLLSFFAIAFVVGFALAVGSLP